MYRPTFGNNDQVRFETEEDYYEFLGFLARGDGSVKVIWERNDEQGAWGAEGRLLFYVNPPHLLGAELRHTAGVGRVISRVNCNEFVEHIVQQHNFQYSATQDLPQVFRTIPSEYAADFHRGFTMQ